MSTYRPNYQDYPPLPPNMPPLPRGPLPALIWSGNGDSYRPSPLGYYPQEHIPQSDFSFRNTKYAPQYPQEQDFSRGIQPAQYTRQSDSRPRARNNHRDDANLNRHRRGNYHYTRPYRVAPVDRPLLRRQNDGGDSPEQMLGMATGQAKFLAAGDVSDSEEEVMDESESEAGRGEENHEELGTIYLTGDQHVDGGGSEAPAKRRATAAGARDGASEPKWSNPDPYTVLPPIDDEQRKRKDVVKLIRKARKDADDANIAEHNQVIANDDFISFGMDDDPPAVIEEIPSSPSADPRENFGADVAGAPSKPRPFSHLQNLHNQNNGAPGTNGQSVVADSMGPPPGLAQAPKAPPAFPNRIILDRAPSNARESIEAFQDKALGNGRRTHDDFIKGGSGPWGKAKGKKAKATGPILQEWVPNPGIDATPWLQRSGILTANAGFR